MTSRILTSDEGYSLIELLVAIALVGIVSLSVSQLIRVSMQTYTRAASLEFSQMGARAGLNGIATDLRYLGSYYNGIAGAGAAITAATTTSLTFLGDVDGNTLDAAGGENTLAAPANAGSTQMTVARATDPSGDPAFGVGGYVYVGSGSTGEVVQITAVAGTVISFPQPGLVKTYPAGSLVRSVETVAYTFNAPPTGTLTRRINGGEASVMVDNVSGLVFTYYDGANPPAQTVNAGLIRQINVGVTVTQPDGGSRTMATRIRPVSLGP
jgi:prepilin-type N-terminal cleavage/methylation domain-containing protein